MKIKNYKHVQSGIGLIEVIAALGISTVIITSLVSLSIFTLRSSLRSKLLLESSKTSNRELELVRAYRDKNTWTDFKTNMASCRDNFCCMKFDASGIIAGTCYGDRETAVVIENLKADETMRGFKTQETDDVIEVTVLVNWRDGKDVKSTSLHTELTNWQKK